MAPEKTNDENEIGDKSLLSLVKRLPLSEIVVEDYSAKAAKK